MKKLEITASLLLTIALTTLIIINVISDNKSNEAIEEMDYKIDKFISRTTSYMLYDPDNARKFKANGVFFTKEDYYCVKTVGRDWNDIRNTDYHEMCHAFVKMDRKHFCSKLNQTAWNVEDYIKQ